MKKTLTFLLLLSLLLSSFVAFSQSILINEFMASNDATIADEQGEYDDWVELYNYGSTAITLNGMYVTDDLSDSQKWQIPVGGDLITLPAGGFVLLWFDKDPEQGPLHVDMKLSGNGEQIGLFTSDGATPIDTITFGPQAADISYGRSTDGSSTWELFAEPTPGASNNSSSGTDYVETPVATPAGGKYSGQVTVTLTCGTPSAQIRYTLNGSEPEDDSPLYTAPLVISASTPLRAKAFANGYLPSYVSTNTYLIDEDHDFPIVALSFKHSDFFGEGGMYDSFNLDITVPVNVEFFEPDGSLGFNQPAKADLHGTASVEQPQRSLNLKAKSFNGLTKFEYKIFPDLEYDKYASFLLRNSGQDWIVTTFRDGFLTDLVRDVSDVNGIMKKPNLHLQGYRPGVVYFNGEYWGIYNIRERLDKKYMKRHFDLGGGEYDYLVGVDGVKEGDTDAWFALQNFLLDNDFANQTNFDLLKDMVDVTDYRDYILFNIYIDNFDWPGNNNKRWRKRTENGKWRWLVFDLDFTYGLVQEGGGWNTGDFTANALHRLMVDNGWNAPNPEWSTRLFRKMIDNEKWRHEFINKMADNLNVLYTTERANSHVDDFVNVYQGEIQDHMDKWREGFNSWDEDVNKLRIFANGRTQAVREHFVSEFADITGTSNVTVNANPADGGMVRFNTVHLDEDDYPWVGVYFNGIDIPVDAYPARGKVFTNWSGASTSSEPAAIVNLGWNVELTANFADGSSATNPIVITEINYHSADDLDSGDWVELYNPNNQGVDISGWYFEDESGKYFGIPASTVLAAGDYIILAGNIDKFYEIYPNAVNVIGSFEKGPLSFNLSKKDELIQLKNADGTLIDEVHYYDSTPWPEAADGTGATLQLVAPDLDNMLAENWVAGTPSPEGVVGIFEPLVDKKLFRLFPNPATDGLFVGAKDGITGTYTMSVSNLLGQNVLMATVDTENGEMVDVSGLESGYYTVRFTQNDKVIYATKLLIEK